MPTCIQIDRQTDILTPIDFSNSSKDSPNVFLSIKDWKIIIGTLWTSLVALTSKIAPTFLEKSVDTFTSSFRTPPIFTFNPNLLIKASGPTLSSNAIASLFYKNEKETIICLVTVSCEDWMEMFDCVVKQEASRHLIKSLYLVTSLSNHHFQTLPLIWAAELGGICYDELNAYVYRLFWSFRKF